MALRDVWNHDDPSLVREHQRTGPAREPLEQIRPASRVAIYHRNGLFVDAIQTLLEFESVDVQQADSIESLFEFAGSSDTCVIDMRLEGARDALRALSGRFEQLRLVGIGGTDDEPLGRDARSAGAHACVGAAEGLDRLLAVIQGTGSTDTPHAARRRASRRPNRDPSRLTTRESEILDGLLEGENTKMLAARLGVSQATARTHVQSVLTKLGAHTRLEAVAMAQSHKGLSLLRDDAVGEAS